MLHANPQNDAELRFMDSLRERYPIKPRKIIKKIISSLSVYISIFIAFIFFSIFSTFKTNNEIQVTEINFSELMIFALIIALTIHLIYEILYFPSYYYASDPKNIRIKKGVLSKKEVTLPYDRVTDLYAEQDILDRIFGLYDIHLSTATASSAMEAHIDGLNRKDAEELKKFILDKMNQTENLK